jgi:hypothetical protein
MDAPAPRQQLDIRRLLLLWGVSVPLIALSAVAVLLGWLGFIGFAPGCDGGSCPQARSTPVVFATLALACAVVWVVATGVVLGCIRSAPERIGWLRVVVLAFPAAAAPFVCIYLGLANGSLVAIPVVYLLWMAIWAAAVRTVVQAAADPIA